MNHVLESLSAFLDGSLPEAERRLVETHLAQCGDCRRESEELRSITKLVAGLPQKPLPAGFMERFQRRRALASVRADEPKEISSFFAFSPKILAFAISGLFVGLVIYHERENILIPQSVSMTAVISNARNDVSNNYPASAGQMVQGPAQGVSAAAAGARLRIESRDRLHSMGTSIDGGGVASPAYTNETLHKLLEGEQKKMGIQKILPPGSQAEESESAEKKEAHSRPDKYAREMAASRAAMQQMTKDLSRILEAKQAPSVALRGKATPALLDQPQAARAAAGAPLESSIQVQGFVLRSTEDLSEFWSRLNTGKPIPAVDFNRDMAVAVYVSAPANYQIEIDSIQTTKDRVIVRYGVSARSAKLSAGAPSPLPLYQLQNIPKTDLPVAFEKSK